MAEQISKMDNAPKNATILSAERMSSMLTRHNLLFWLSLLAIFVLVLLPGLGFGAALAQESEPPAQEPLAFAAGQPAEAFENEAYTWNISVN
jgi:hypothetical protein